MARYCLALVNFGCAHASVGISPSVIVDGIIILHDVILRLVSRGIVVCVVSFDLRVRPDLAPPSTIVIVGDNDRLPRTVLKEFW